MKKTFYGAHHKNINEDRPIRSASKCRLIVLVSRNIRYMRIFLGIATPTIQEKNSLGIIIVWSSKFQARNFILRLFFQVCLYRAHRAVIFAIAQLSCLQQKSFVYMCRWIVRCDLNLNHVVLSLCSLQTDSYWHYFVCNTIRIMFIFILYLFNCIIYSYIFFCIFTCSYHAPFYPLLAIRGWRPRKDVVWTMNRYNRSTVDVREVFQSFIENALCRCQFGVKWVKIGDPLLDLDPQRK